MLILNPSDLISTGMRECYYHPENPDLCVKVPIRKHDAEIVLRRELSTYNQVKEILSEFVIPYNPELVETNRGLGIVCHLLRNEDKSIAKSLYEYRLTGEISEDVVEQICRFYWVCLKNRLYFYDLNSKNFLIQIKSGRKYIKYSDLKSYRRTQSLLQFDNFIPLLAAMKMRRRLKRLLRYLGIDPDIFLSVM